MRRLTFDMRGGRQMAKPDVGRPLDGSVRPRCSRVHELRPYSDTAAAYTKTTVATSDSQAPARFATRTMFADIVLPRVSPLCPVMAASGMETQKKYDETIRQPAMTQETIGGTENDGNSTATENIKIAAIGRL